jgi:hypothetical protein
VGNSNQTWNFFIWFSLLFYSMFIFQVLVVLEVDNQRWFSFQDFSYMIENLVRSSEKLDIN